MSRRLLAHLGGVAAIVCCVALSAPVAIAQTTQPPSPSYTTPPMPDPQLHPSAAPIGPSPDVTERTNKACVSADPNSTGTITQAPWGQTQLRFPEAWPLSTGKGVAVAVIDTGVTPHPRLGGRLIAGGDYVSNTSGIEDCDGHGTIVAGIIAASADPTGTTAFAGVAPDATIISIRQSSKYYNQVGKQADSDGYGNLNTLARSVVRAVDLGARVINISEASCRPATVAPGDGQLNAALKMAADRDVVVVVAAGNTGGDCSPQNSTAPAQPGVSGESAATTIPSPAWFSDNVLAVGSMGRDGAPSKFTLAGPWVGVAGPGEDITSLDPAPGRSGLTNRLAETPGSQAGAIQGTSFATPYVAGTVALVRSRFPSMTAKQVLDRIKATAHRPSGGWSPSVGFGMVDPVAAVSDVLVPGVTAQAANNSTAQTSPPTAPPAPDNKARNVAFIGAASALAAMLVTFAVLDATRRHRRRAERSR